MAGLTYDLPDVRKGRMALTLLGAFSGGALMLAAITEYVFGYAPCELCLWQRVPLALAFGIAAMGLVTPVPAEAKIWAAGTGAVLLAIGAGIAAYHSGVEWGWWQGLPSCGGGIPELSFEGFGESLSQPAQPGCGEAPFRILGLSMAGWNVVASGLCAVALFALIRRVKT